MFENLLLPAEYTALLHHAWEGTVSCAAIAVGTLCSVRLLTWAVVAWIRNTSNTGIVPGILRLMLIILGGGTRDQFVHHKQGKRNGRSKGGRNAKGGTGEQRRKSLWLIPRHSIVFLRSKSTPSDNDSNKAASMSKSCCTTPYRVLRRTLGDHMVLDWVVALVAGIHFGAANKHFSETSQSEVRLALFCLLVIRVIQPVTDATEHLMYDIIASSWGKVRLPYAR